MTVNCSICLNIFEEPVCLPCGHIYCSKCLSDHINALPSKGMTASCPECRTTFNIFTPELACLPKQYHQFILPSIRRVYLDLTTCSNLQKKLDQAEARLKLHKTHEEALGKRCESFFAALNAHRAGESEALHNAQVLKVKMATCIEDHPHDIDGLTARLQQLDQEHKLLQSKYIKVKTRCQELNEQVLAQAEKEEPRSGPSTRSLATELRAMKPLPKRVRRVFRRTRSISPSPVHDSLVKRPRLSEGTQ